MSKYRQGTVSIDNGTSTVYGLGTRWLSYIKSGDIITINTVNLTIQTVVDNNEIIVTTPWDSASVTNINYQIDIQETLEKAKARVLLKINTILAAKEVLPIVYNNILCDADTKTVSINLPGKIKEIEIREAINNPMSAQDMFWKDADNIVHTWTDQTVYKLWLQGLVIAISSRNTALYARAWAKKAEVDALTDINDIINYDITTGWD